MLIELDIDDCWYELELSEVVATKGHAARLTGHPDSWHDGEDDYLSYVIDSITHGTEEGDVVTMTVEQAEAFIRSNQDAISAAVWEKL